MKNKMKNFIKTLAYYVLYLISKLISQKGVPILMYHSIGHNNAFYAVIPEEFEKQIRYLKQKCNVVSLDEIIDFVEERKDLPKNRKAVAITFDDGYYDNYLNAYPILNKYGLPATIFVATGYCNNEMPLSGIKLKMLGWNKIKEMSENGIDIGAHTVAHPKLTEISPKEAWNEILGSKEEIERQIGRKVVYFAYPKGRYNEEIVNIVKSSGFKGAFAGEGLVQRGDDLFTLKRTQIDSLVTFIMFKAKLTKAYEWYKRLAFVYQALIKKSARDKKRTVIKKTPNFKF